MKIYNEQSGLVEEFVPLEKNTVKMYVCGPTLYNDIHIGNARPIIFFDFVRKIIQKNGYNVVYASNITDVDDKIIKRAQELNISEEKLVMDNLIEFNRILRELNISYDYQPRVTENIDLIIDFITRLVKKQNAYNVDGDIYFDVTSLPKYGKLSNLNLSQNQVASRIDANDSKHNPNDFVLWKKTAEGIKWDSPWSEGRPGWHTECVVMIRSLLGDKIDIHGGGIDLQFPHHENENAQSCAMGNDLAKYWMHNGFIKINDEKMSKSLGNTLLVKDFLDQYGPNVLKLIMFQTNYRQPINLTSEFISSTQKINQKFNTYSNKCITTKMDYSSGDVLKIASNDFDAPNLITYLLQVIKDDSIDSQIIFNTGIDLLGLSYEKDIIPKEVEELVQQRTRLKAEKNYEMADKVREKIHNLGFEVVDTPEGSICKKIMK